MCRLEVLCSKVFGKFVLGLNLNAYPDIFFFLFLILVVVSRMLFRALCPRCPVWAAHVFTGLSFIAILESSITPAECSPVNDPAQNAGTSGSEKEPPLEESFWDKLIQESENRRGKQVASTSQAPGGLPEGGEPAKAQEAEASAGREPDRNAGPSTEPSSALPGPDQPDLGLNPDNLLAIADEIQRIHGELHTRVPAGFQAERLSEILEYTYGPGRMGQILQSLKAEGSQSPYFPVIQTLFKDLRKSGGTEQQLRKEWQGRS